MVATLALEPDLLAGETPSTPPVVHPAAQNPVPAQDHRGGQAADTRHVFLVLASPMWADGAPIPSDNVLKLRPADKAGLSSQSMVNRVNSIENRAILLSPIHDDIDTRRA